MFGFCGISAQDRFRPSLAVFSVLCVFLPPSSGLRHPNVVTVMGALVYTDRVKIVMERCTPFHLPPVLGAALRGHCPFHLDSPSLGNVLVLGGSFLYVLCCVVSDVVCVSDYETRLRHFLGMCRGVAFLHASHLLHSDIKLDHFLVRLCNLLFSFI